MAGGLQHLGQPALRILAIDEPNVADVATLDHLAHLTHHGIPRIGVGHGQNQLTVVCQTHQLLGLSRSVSERLVAHDMDAAHKTRLDVGVVCFVGGDHHGEIDIPRLQPCHLLGRGVEPVFVPGQALGPKSGFFPDRGKNTPPPAWHDPFRAKARLCTSPTKAPGPPPIIAYLSITCLRIYLIPQNRKKRKEDKGGGENPLHRPSHGC